MKKIDISKEATDKRINALQLDEKGENFIVNNYMELLALVELEMDCNNDNDNDNYGLNSIRKTLINLLENNL